ncbi:MAG: PQQ-dependent sugar dehydrogenase [Phycisphaerae bacterium]|nr:PQQ-dependent sugar dehydrogenase [Phycisphaerae bacterium]
MTRSLTRHALIGLAAASISLLAPASASAQTIDTLRVASALEWPLFVTYAPGEPYFIYIVLKRGRIIRQDLRTGAQSVFIDLDPVIVNPTSVSDERGLLGLAFHRNYAANGYFWVYYVSNSATNVVARYQRSSPGVGNPASGQVLVNISDPFTNHNGGWISFRPDDTQGYLYFVDGDGGSANDPNQNGQNVNTLLGKMCRIDIDGPDNIPGTADDGGTFYTNPPTNPFFGATPGLDEIWAYGLRNPWRCSFDRLTGALYIGDVGQDSIEEHNFQSTSSAGGQNYGWRCYEGNNVTGLCGTLPTGVTFPFHTYTHALGISTTGGYVYRGCAIPAVYGQYFFADYGTARIWTYGGTSATANPTGPLTERTADVSPPIGGGSIASVASFGEDAFGEMYIIRHSTAAGEIFRIVPPGNAITDCNGNNVADCGEIALGLVNDCNANNLIDSCEIAANPALDCDGNQQIDSCEIAAEPALDCDGNNVLDVCQIAANPALDCNGNFQLDSCEIAANPALDCNANNRLDACEMCLGDADNDHDVDFSDITAELSAFGANYLPCLVGFGDGDKNGSVNFADITATLSQFGAPCP